MKKILSIVLVSLLFVVMTSCDLLSTIKALKGFSEEYPLYADIYQNTTYYTVSSETVITVAQTNIEGLVSMTSDLYFAIDKTSGITYVDQTINDVNELSLFVRTSDLLIEYQIDEAIVTPIIPEVDADNTTDGIFNMDDGFSVNDVSNELIVEDHWYQFDVYLSKVIDLEKLTVFAEKLKAFDNEFTMFDDAVATVNIKFNEVESVIDIDAIVTDYRIEFEDSSFAVVSISNHTLMKVPTDFSTPDVFSSDYQMVAVDDIRLATKVYSALEQIVFPVTAFENGWIQVYLEAGTYDLISDYLSYFSTSIMYNQSQEVIPYNPVGMIQVTVTEAGNYYFYLVPDRDFTFDLMFSNHQ